MGQNVRINPTRFLDIIVVLVFCIFALGSHEWAYAESNATIGVVGAAYTSSQEDSWIASDFEGQVNRPLLIHLTLSPYPPPAGAFYTAIVDVLESPARSQTRNHAGSA